MKPEALPALTSAPQNAAAPAAPARAPMKMMQIHLSEAACERLAFHTANGQWTTDSLIEELIRGGLHKAYPAIKYRGQEIAEAGRFRAFDHKGSQGGVVLKSSLGEYRIQPRPDNADFKRWMEIYARRGGSDFREKAAEMCLFLLGQQLQEIREEGFKQVIYPEDFLVEQFV